MSEIDREAAVKAARSVFGWQLLARHSSLSTEWLDRTLDAMVGAAIDSAVHDLITSWREAYGDAMFPCDAAYLDHVNATVGPNTTARVAAYMMRHWADVLEQEMHRGG